MIWLLLLGVIVLLTVIGHYFYVAEGRWIVGPETFFLIMAVGTYLATAYTAVVEGGTESPYTYYIGVGIVCFVAGCVVCRATLGFGHRRELQRFLAGPWRNDLRGVRLAAVVFVGLLSVAVTAVYFMLLGFFVPAAAAGALLTRGPDAMVEVYNELRRASSTGEYLGLGYVSQFKNCLLPLVTLLLFFRARIRGTMILYVLVVTFLTVSVLGSIGTGARFALAFLGISLLVIGIAPIMRPLQLSGRQLLTVVLLSLLLLSALTLMMGARGSRTLDVPILWAPYAVVERVFIAPSMERYQVYDQFLRHQEPQWGRGTLRELRNVLPGRPPLTLSNRLHQMIYGSPQGNVTLDLWGSFWYEFHWLGLLFAFFHGFVLHAFYVWTLRGPKRLSRVVVLLFAGIVLGLATDLQVLLLRGFLTCFLLLACLYVVEKIADFERMARRPGNKGLANA